MEGIIRKNHDIALVAAVIGILLVLFAPIPAALLDLLIIINFAMSLTILLMTFYVEKPVSFSTFPSLLLVATLFRLSLNVAATRLILSGANAGEVIASIGSFAVQGNFIIGLVIFFILVVVQYVVVTAGAQRVSEVAARFVLDSVPGQQMSIDADLNMGLIDQNEAKRRRKSLEREAAFYGSMDGASKFVKGDAIAGIIILFIDIVAGWAVGVAQMEMEWADALQTFTLLTIGDGIVTQVPALIISVATGIIVTRSSADRQLSEEIFSQLSAVPKIPLLVLATLLLLLLLPGMPKWPIAILILAALAAFFAMRAKGAGEENSSLFDVPDDEVESGPRGPAPAIEVILGKALGQHWASLKQEIGDRITALRTQQEAVSGFSIPPVLMRDGSSLEDNGYEIHIFGARYGAAIIFPERTLAIPGDPRTELPGVKAHDPAFGLPSFWVDQNEIELARDKGCTLVDPLTVTMTHLGEVMRSEASALLSRSEVVQLLEGVRSRQPGLIEELIPAVMTVSDVQRVLQSLLAEEVSIRNIDQIVEVLVDVARTEKDSFQILELVRQRLSHSICQGLRGSHPQLSVLSLDPRLESGIADSIRRSGAASTILDPRLADNLIKGLLPRVEDMIQKRLSPVLLCGPEIRRHLKTFTRRSIPRLAVISVSEVPHNVDLASFGVIMSD